MLLHIASFRFSLSLSRLLVFLIPRPLELPCMFDKSAQPTQTKDDSFTKYSWVRSWTVAALCFYTSLTDLLWTKVLPGDVMDKSELSLGWNLLSSCSPVGFRWETFTAAWISWLREALGIKLSTTLTLMCPKIGERPIWEESRAFTPALPVTGTRCLSQRLSHFQLCRGLHKMKDISAKLVLSWWTNAR